MIDEKIFLSEGSTYISNTKIVLGNTTYSTANITSVAKTYTPANTGCSVILVVLGVFGALGAVASMFTKDVGSGIVLLAFSAGLVALGVFWYRSLRPDYHVMLASASGERRGLTSKDQAAIDRVISAVTDAITHRG